MMTWHRKKVFRLLLSSANLSMESTPLQIPRVHLGFLTGEERPWPREEWGLLWPCTSGAAMSVTHSHIHGSPWEVSRAPSPAGAGGETVTVTSTLPDTGTSCGMPQWGPLELSFSPAELKLAIWARYLVAESPWYLVLEDALRGHRLCLACCVCRQHSRFTRNSH